MYHEGEVKVANYSTFYLENYDNYYLAHTEGYSGDAGNSMALTNNRNFSTHDADHDSSTANCAALYQGAWWFAGCHYSHLNGVWVANSSSYAYAQGLCWYHWKGYYYSLMSDVMRISRNTGW